MCCLHPHGPIIFVFYTGKTLFGLLLYLVEYEVTQNTEHPRVSAGQETFLLHELTEKKEGQ